MNRSQFLQKVWKKYPASRENAMCRGRLIEIKTRSNSNSVGNDDTFETNETAELSEVELCLEHDFEKKKFRVKNSSIVQILRVGDLIEILSGDSEVVLLAPNLTANASTFRRTRWGGHERAVQLGLWNDFVRCIREFFVNKGFLEIATPSLVVCPGTEPSLEVYKTIHIQGGRSREFFLPTSPELHLKKCLGLGFEKIFEITKSYRNNEMTDRHQAEFWILEWYRAFREPKSIEEDLEDLIFNLAEALPGARRPKRVVHKSVAQLFLETFSFELTPITSEAELKTLAQDNSIDVHAATSIDDIFFLLFYEIEQKMNPDDLLFVVGYPPYQAALARIDDQGWAERFEVYWQGFELANAFHELNDPAIQRERARQDILKRESSGKQKIPFDEEFFEALEGGLPPASGIALGLERLFMAFYGINKIQDVRLFPMGIEAVTSSGPSKNK
ncbi:MAG: EF-P lysine aminoacylase GenX [Bdellovibrionaceae bacterium]|nr:EF-P lysine aminoacylase GenX [Pseudobdellovibrionaceae bacterium]